MKKIIALGFALVLTQAIHAQSNISGGLKISPSLGWLKTDPNNTITQIENNGTHFGFAYGGFLDYFFNDRFGLDIELRHALQTYSYKVTTAAVDTRTIHLQYLELPVTIKMRTNEIGYMKYFGQIGLMPAIKLKSRYDQTRTINGGSTTGQDDNFTNRTTDWSGTQMVNPVCLYLVVGAGAEYNLGGNTSLLAGLTFNNGFINLWTPPSGGLENFNDKPAYISLNLGVIF